MLQEPREGLNQPSLSPRFRRLRSRFRGLRSRFRGLR